MKQNKLPTENFILALQSAGIISAPAMPAAKPKPPRPTFDPSEIYNFPKRTSNKSYGLTHRTSGWHIIFYDKNEKYIQRNLYTHDLDDAIRMRDKYYASARKAGRVGETAMQKKAKRILADPTSLEGLKFQVCLGNQSRVFRTPEEQKAFQVRVCKEILRGKLSA